MGTSSSSCSGEGKFRFTDFIAAMYDHDVKGSYIPDEEALGKLKNYASRNPERIPKICEKISAIMQKHLSRKPVAVQKVLMSVKAMYALLDDASFVDPFVPHVIHMVSLLFAAKRHPFYLGGADLLTVMTMKMVQKNSPQNTRRLLKDNKAKLLPSLHRMINLTTLLATQPSLTAARRRSRTPSRAQSDLSGAPQPQRHPHKRFRTTSDQRKTKNLATRVKKEAARPTNIRTSSPSAREKGSSAEEDGFHFTLTHDPELSNKVALLSAGLIAIGNIIFCVPDLVQDFIAWKSVKVIVKHILHTVRHGIFLRQAQNEGRSCPGTPAIDFRSRNASPLLPSSAIPKTVTEEEESSLTIQQHQMLLVQRSAMHALRASASAVTAASIDSMIIMVMECFEEDGEDGAWEMHTAVDLVFNAFVSSLEQQSQKLGMCLCSAIAYVIFLGRVHLQYPPTSQIAPPSAPPASTLGGNLPGVLVPAKAGQEEQPSPRSVGRSILPTVEAATAAAAAARPPVRPEKIPKAFASPAALGGLLRALRQCLLVIPMSGTRPHVFLGAIQMLLGETAFLTSIGAPAHPQEDHSNLTDENNVGPSTHSPVSPFGSFVGTANVHYTLTEAGHRAVEDDDEVSVTQQPFDVVLISLTTALLAAVHTQQNFPSLHLILSFLVETCKPTLVTGSGVLNAKGSGGGRRLRLFMLRLLVRTAPYFRSLPDAQRWDIDVYQCIATHLYDLRQVRNVSLATSILCQLLAGEPRTTRARIAHGGTDADDAKEKKKRRRAVWMTSTRGAADNNAYIVGAADGNKIHDAMGNHSKTCLTLHTSHTDIQRTKEWILIVCHHRKDEVTPRILVELGNVFVALMAGDGVVAIPFVLRSMWNIYVRHGGKCGGKIHNNATNFIARDSADYSGNGVRDPNEEDEDTQSVTSTDGSAEGNSSSNVQFTHCDKAWQQFVLAVLAHIGVVFSIPEISTYVLSVWNRKAAQGELSHCFSGTLKTSWGEEDRCRGEMKYVECGLQLFDPAVGNVWSPRSFGSETPDGVDSTSAHLSSRADRVLIEEDDAPFLHSATPPPVAERSRVSLSFTMIARLLARARRSPIEELFGCSDLHDDEDALVEAIVMHCFSTMAVEEYEAEVFASITGRSGAVGEARETEDSALIAPSFSSALASPMDHSKPSQGMQASAFLQPVPTESTNLHTPETAVNQHVPLISASSAGFSSLFGSPQMPPATIPPLSSMEYLSLVDELNRSAHQNNSSAQFQQTTTLETIPTSQSGGGPKASQSVKFSVGDREQIRKTMVTFDRKDFVNLSVPLSTGNNIKVSKLDQLFTFYGVNPAIPVNQSGLMSGSPAPKPNSPRSRLRLRLKALCGTEEEPVDAEEDNENSRSRPEDGRDRRASKPLPTSDSVGAFSTSSQGGRGIAAAGNIFRFNASTPPAHRYQLGASGSGGDGNKSSRFRYRRATTKSSLLDEEDMWGGTLDKVALRIALMEEEQNRSRQGGREEVEDPQASNGRKLLAEETTWISQLPMWQYFSIP